MRLKTIEKRINNLGFKKTQETPDYLQYERLDRLNQCYQYVVIEHTDNCMYYIKSFAVFDHEKEGQAMGLTYEANDLFTKRIKKMIYANLKEGRY